MVDESRRDLFKTSLISAIGLTSLSVVVGGVAAYEGVEQWARSRTDPDYPTIPIFENDGAQWYIFTFNSSLGQFKVEIASAVNVPKKTPFNTKRTYADLVRNGQLIEYTSRTVTFGNQSYNVSNGYLVSSVNELNAARNIWSEVQKS